MNDQQHKTVRDKATAAAESSAGAPSDTQPASRAATVEAESTQKPDPPTDDRRRALAPRMIRWLVLLGLLVMAALLVYRWIFPPQWMFSVKAKTGIVELVTPKDKETKWRVDNAVICSYGALSEDTAALATARLSDSSCGSHAWVGYRFQDPEQTLVLNGAVNVTLETDRDLGLFIALRRRRSAPADRDARDGQKDPERWAVLTFTDGTPDIALVKKGAVKINLVWPGPYAAAIGRHVDRVFPFSGITTIGRDINWTGTSMLTEGSIRVYTSDNSPDKRQLVDETELVLGDQIRLKDIVRHGERIQPKGFMRHASDGEHFDVVAFGLADRVRIERYGDNGYDFKPGLVARMIHDPLLVWTLSILGAAVGLIAAIAPLFETKQTS